MLLQGQEIADKLYVDINKKIEDLKSKDIEPSLVIVLVKGDPSSAIYSRMIKKNCKKTGIKCNILKFENDITEEELIKEVEKLNKNSFVHGMIIMMPLPKHISADKIQNTIDPNKDIDGINPLNAGRNAIGIEALVPSTAQACRDILHYSNIDISGKNVVILGRSNIVGKPLANLLMQKAKGANATVTVCHSRTQNMKEITKNADIIVAAIGVAKFLTEDFVSEKQIIIDVGMNETKDEEGNFKLVGDVDFENVQDKVKMITPVPGGVSPLTHTALFNNLLKAINLQNL